jgi:hypothetical protein
MTANPASPRIPQAGDKVSGGAGGANTNGMRIPFVRMPLRLNWQWQRQQHSLLGEGFRSRLALHSSYDAAARLRAVQVTPRSHGPKGPPVGTVRAFAAARSGVGEVRRLTPAFAAIPPHCCPTLYAWSVRLVRYRISGHPLEESLHECRRVVIRVRLLPERQLPPRMAGTPRLAGVRHLTEYPFV